MQGLFQTPADAAAFQIHLTINSHGMAWHDGVVLVEVVPGRLGTMQSRCGSELYQTGRWPVNAVVKVFPDDLPASHRRPRESPRPATNANRSRSRCAVRGR